MNNLNWHSEKITDCTALLKNIGWLCRFGLYDTLDMALYNIRIDGNPTMFTGLLRYTCQIQKHTTRLPSWRRARAKAHEELVRRGEDADNTLQGLMEL